MKKMRERLSGGPAGLFIRGTVFVVLTLSAVSLPVKILGVSLDDSWKGVLTEASAHRRQFGADLLCTYGPLGHLTSDVYAGQPLAPQAAWELACKALLALLALWASARLPSRWLAALFLAVTCLFSTLDPDAFFFFLIVLIGVFMMEAAEHKCIYWLEGASFLALVAMTKFSYFLLATLAVAAAVWKVAIERSPRDAAFIAGTYFVLILAVWSASGQDPRHLPAFLLGSWEMTRGYGGAMGLTVLPWMLACGLAAFLCAAAALVFLYVRSRPDQRPEIALTLTAVFLSWKAAFVRPDMHVVVLFTFCLLVFFLYAPRLLALKKGRSPALALGALSALVSLGTLYQIGRSLGWPYFVSGSPQRVARQTAGNARLLLDLPGRQRFLDEGLARQWALLDMPRTRAALGGAAVDMLGDAQGLLLLNNFRYAPRPAFQSYFAYTPYLLRRNAEYLAGPNSPEYLLAKIDPIDGRFPASEDGLALREALENYEPVLTERTCLLMRRKTRRDKSRESVFLASREYRWGEPVILPASATGVWAEIEIHENPLGKLVSLLYHAPLISLKAELAEGPARGFRLVPAAVREGFLLDPVVEDADTLARASKPTPRQRMKSFALNYSEGAGALLEPTFRASFYAAGL